MSEEKRQTPPTSGGYPPGAGTGGYPSGANVPTGSGASGYPGYGYTGQTPYYPQQPTQTAAPTPPPTTPQQPSYYQPGMQPGMPYGMQASMMPSPVQAQPSASQVPGMLPIEESYIENILRLNKGKVATIYMTFENNERWNAMIFKGVVEAAGRDHIIISDPETGKRHILLMVYLDYITFGEELEYEYPNVVNPGLTNYPPR